MMDCKKALVEADGNFDKAFELLRQKGIASAAKKQSRATSEGLVVGEVSADGKRGALVEINCETDFVARNEEFQELAKTLAKTALESKATSVEELGKAKHGGGTIAGRYRHHRSRGTYRVCQPRLRSEQWLFRERTAGAGGQHLPFRNDAAGSL